MSKNDGDQDAFFAFPIDTLAINDKVTFDVFIHLPLNNRTLKFMSSGDVFTGVKLEEFRKKKIDHLHARESDRDKYYDYIARNTKFEARSEESGLLIETMEESSLSAEQKSKILRTASRKLLKTLAEDGLDSNKALKKCHEIVEDIIMVSRDSSKTLRELLHIKSLYPPSDHSINTATFSTLIAMGTGCYDRDFISELAMTGLLHDIGLLKINSLIVDKPEIERSHDEDREYSKHVHHGIELLEKHNVSISETTLTLIRQHHERYDGSGYPEGIGGKILSASSFIFSFSNMLDNMTSGRYNGNKMSYVSAFRIIAKLQRGDDPNRNEARLFESAFFQFLYGFLQESTDEKIVD